MQCLLLLSLTLIALSKHCSAMDRPGDASTLLNGCMRMTTNVPAISVIPTAVVNPLLMALSARRRCHASHCRAGNRGELLRIRNAMCRAPIHCFMEQQCPYLRGVRTNFKFWLSQCAEGDVDVSQYVLASSSKQCAGAECWT